MHSALERGRPIRYRPAGGGKKPPECAGIYYIRDAEGNVVYTGQAVNLRRRVYQHRRKAKIPDGGYVDCFRAKEGITCDDLDATEREKINKHNPPLNQRKGGGGRKSPKLGSLPAEDIPVLGTPSLEQNPEKKHNILYRLLGYERIDKMGEVFYKKEPKSVFFIIIELIVKVLLVANTVLALVALYLTYSMGTLLEQVLIIVMIAVPIICFILFRYIRRSKVFTIIAIICLIAAIVLYQYSYPLSIKWPF